MVLAHHREQQAEHAAARRGDGHVGVRGVAREQQPGRGPAEPLLAHPRGGQQEEPEEPQRVGRADPAQELGGPRTGGNVVNRLRSNGSSTARHCA